VDLAQIQNIPNIQIRKICLYKARRKGKSLLIRFSNDSLLV